MKLWKKVCSFIAALGLCLGFTACGGSSADGYTLIVKDSNGNVMSNYAITICVVENGVKSTCLPPQTTDANGKVTFKVDKGNYAVSDVNEMDNITLQGDYYLSNYGTTNVTVIVG